MTQVGIGISGFNFLILIPYFCSRNSRCSFIAVYSSPVSIQKYASRELIELLSKKSYYLFRLRSKFNVEIDALPIGSHIITLYDYIKVRIVKFTLPSGETETLLTNLFDLDEAEFKDLYFKRWRVEVKYDVVKTSWKCRVLADFQKM